MTAVAGPHFRVSRPTTALDRMPKAIGLGWPTHRNPGCRLCWGYTTSSAAVPRDDGGSRMAGIRPGLPPFLESDLDLWGCQLLDGISPVHRT